MITGGNATVYVTNMDMASKFYSEVLSLKVSSHYGDHWATVEAGAFTIGLHPKAEEHAVPGTRGSIQIGLSIDGAIEVARKKLVSCNVRSVGEVQRGSAGNFVSFEDPDGNELYLWEAPKW